MILEWIDVLAAIPDSHQGLQPALYPGTPGGQPLDVQTPGRIGLQGLKNTGNGVF